ncbi:hypothetical protein FJZ26_05640, partial [Candidatus Parvarchaeota archaeon]|nr:hypothetical protein [Candidatus Parvarchaeota archaeon]
MKELLISTDVDEIIERIKERRSIRLKELAASLSMDQREVRKWAEVLESQGLISIDHQLTQEILTWTEKQAKKINHDATFEVEAIKQPVEIIEIAKGEPEQQEKAPVAPIISEKPALQMEEKEAWRRLPGMKEKQPESKIFEEDELFGSRQPKEQDTDNKTKEAELQAPKVTQDFELEEKKVQQVQEMRAKEVPRAKPEKKAQAAKQLAREK